ncbi:hypothetical protein B0H16DRAFT_590699 [Mycena metata]|uniref:F-box domain-containing protein n=1 Tax=Mycena metata TaxID=1033252 RepID=A0AAD7H469_9AGAR|nr:hypothetical protein B0H16DRAFT_590699 [Mycena metata]
MAKQIWDFSTQSILLALRSNLVPEPADCLAIQTSIAEAEEWLLSNGKGGSLSSSDAEFDEIRNFISLSSSRLAPIRRLLPEILSIIFLHPSIYSPPALGLEHTSPVTAVSSHWRAVALTTPALWSRFSISLHGSEGAFQMLRLYLQRSKASSLTIEIRQKAHRGSIHPGIVDHLIQSSDRWMRVTFPLDHYTLSLFNAVRGRLSSLEVASFSDRSVGSDPEVSLQDIIAFEDAPKLHSLSLRNVGQNLPRFPLEQLERALFTNMAGSTVFATISRSPNLRSLTCHWPAILPGMLLEVPTVLFSSLTTITLKGDFILLRNLAVPNLTSLAFTDMQRLPGPVIASFIEQSQCRLHTLVFDKVWTHGSSLLQILRAAATLHTLTITWGKPNLVTETAMEALIVAPGGEPLLPALREFTLYGAYLFHTSTLLDMLESRSQSVTDAPRLHIADMQLDHRLFSDEQLERFRRLKGSLDLTLQYTNAQKVSVQI